MSNTRRIHRVSDKKINEFLQAIEDGRVLAVQDLLDDYRRLLDSDRNGWKPFVNAAYYGRTEIVKLLLKAGADINQTDGHGRTPLIAALENQKYETAKFLLEAGADPDKAGGSDDGTTPMYIAVMTDNVSMVKLLLEYDADPNKPDGRGRVPLNYAVNHDNNRMIKLLLANNANPNWEDDNGDTPLYMAAQDGRYRIAELLLNSGANVNIGNADNEKPLNVATQNGHDRIVKLIQERILFRAAMDTISVAKAKGMNQDEALQVFKKTVKKGMKAAGNSDFDVDNSQIHSKLYRYFQGVMRSRNTRTRFGKSNGKKPQKRPSSAVCTRAQKLGVRLTLKRNNKRVYKSEEMLRKQIKNAVTKQNKRKQKK